MLSPAQNFAAVREFAEAGHIGARIYDYLIAKTALSASLDLLVTWNNGHFTGLVKGLEVRTPITFLSNKTER
jgi:predicted nucleic acid-binding protein